MDNLDLEAITRIALEVYRLGEDELIYNRYQMYKLAYLEDMYVSSGIAGNNNVSITSCLSVIINIHFNVKKGDTSKTVVYLQWYLRLIKFTDALFFVRLLHQGLDEDSNKFRELILEYIYENYI